MIKLHIGCGLDLKEGYINIDMESKEDILKRYEGSNNVAYMAFKDKDIEICRCDIFKLPYANETVDEIASSAFLEHLSFVEERKFFFEVKRVLKQGGILRFGVPDFEWIVRKWLAAKDNWRDFYYTDKGEHYFGQGNRNMDSRWGYLTTTLFGNQGSDGQYHKNAYTRGKIHALMEKLGFELAEMRTGYYRGQFEQTLECVARKK